MRSSDAVPGDGPICPVTDGVRVVVRVQPGARRSGIDGLVARAEGGKAVKIRVTEPPEGGKANAAVIKLLAKAWGVPKGRIAVAAGAKDRRKILHVAGDPADLRARIEDWIARLSGEERG